MRGFLIKISTVLIILAFVAMIFSPHNRIRRYVKKHHIEIETTCNAYPVQDQFNEKYDGMSVTQATLDSNVVYYFYYSGFGLAPSTKYYGFMYSTEDQPLPADVLSDNSGLIPDGEDSWKWEGEGDNGGEVERIMDHFYYFVSWY